MIQQIITFDGGLSTKKAPHIIERNEGIICENVNLETGSLTPLYDFIYTDNVTGKYIYPYNEIIISNANDTDDRHYDSYGGRVYWTNASYSAFGLKRYDGTSIGEDAQAPAAPNTAPTNTLSSGQLSGDYVYCYTFVDTDGIESAPSAFLSVSPLNQQVDLTMPDTNAPADLATRNIYRTGGDNPTFNLIGEVAVGTTTFTDNTRDIDVSRIELYTFDNYPPKESLDMLIECNGTMWGAFGNNVYFSKTGSPEYWGLLDYVTLDKECTGLGKLGDTVVAFTRTGAYVITGSTRDDIDVQRLPFGQGCTNKHSIVNIDAYLLWASLDGICIFNGATIEVITKKTLSWDEFGRVGNYTYSDFDGTNTKWESSLGFDIKFSTGYQDRYYGVFSDGILTIDLSNGLTISTIRLAAVETLAVNRDDNLLYALIPNETSGFDIYYLPASGATMEATWKTGRIADESTDVLKHYRDVELDATPTSVEVFVDGVSVKKYTGERQFKLPAGTFGKDIQFEIITSNEIRSLKYEYSNMKA